MKKILLAVSAFMLSCGALFSQLEIGIHVSPTISTTRIATKSDDYTFTKNRSGLRFCAGPIVDLFLTDNVAFSTGLWYSSKRTSVALSDNAIDTAFTTTIDGQYLQVPISFKFLTQEVTTGLKLFVQLGATLDVKISEKVYSATSGEEEVQIASAETHTKFYDSGLFTALGVEYKIGPKNKLFGGFTYNRSFINTLTKDTGTPLNKDVVALNPDIFGLMVGYKF